jgi:hypothetical protein
MKGKLRHRYMHRFASGNIGTITFRLPTPCRFKVQWLKRPSAEDVAEYRVEWRAIILTDLTMLDGKLHQIIDEVPAANIFRPATAETAAA